MNKLGHDNLSEISTLIKRMREGKFVLLEAEKDKFIFEIKLTHHYTVPVPHQDHTTIKYTIQRMDLNNSYEYRFMQINGEPSRKIKTVDGWIIWGLLEETINNQTK